MKKSLIIALLLGVVLVLGTTAAQADDGPFYAYWSGSCHVIEAFVNFNTGTVYGHEVGGCESAHNVGGALFNNAIVSAGYEYQGDPRIYVYNLNGTVEIWQNLGTSLMLFNSGTWFFGPAPTSVELQSTSALPNPNE